ncbi:hypothetical protein [Micromonospora chersina]|uniref:hypothetical protein n=1 Tax=Micromonospora chersina TaxID=47854 RepID=UPI00371165D9
MDVAEQVRGVGQDGDMGAGGGDGASRGKQRAQLLWVVRAGLGELIGVEGVASLHMRHHSSRLLLAALMPPMFALLGLSACGDQAEHASGSSSGPTPPTAEGVKPPVSVPATRSAAATTAPPELHFERSMVRSNEVNKENKGGQANVELVAGSNDLKTLERVGRECVEVFLKEQKAAFCKVFGSEADYKARDLRKAGDSNCWAWYVGVPLAGGEAMATEGGEVGYVAERCPGKLYR